MKYKCLACEYKFESLYEIPYCPACDNEGLEEIPFNDDKYVKGEKKEDHHIWPRFMDNPNGAGQQFPLYKETHFILHGSIMKWLWEEFKEEDKERVIKNIIAKSKKFIGVGDGRKD